MKYLAQDLSFSSNVIDPPGGFPIVQAPDRPIPAWTPVRVELGPMPPNSRALVSVPDPADPCKRLYRWVRADRQLADYLPQPADTWTQTLVEWLALVILGLIVGVALFTALIYATL